MVLTIDWGNSRVKGGVFNTTGFLIQTYNWSHDDAVSAIAGVIEHDEISRAILCNVAHVPPILLDFFRSEAGFMLFDHETPLPIINAYQTPGTLGLDRLAACVAAKHLNPNKDNIVISAGSAIVFSLITKTGIFRGGSISPGVTMRLRALHEFTDNLPVINNKGMVTLVGYDTESAMKTGAILGAAAEIDGFINYYKEQFPEINSTITGGDASLLSLKIKNKIFADEHITLKGLYLIYKHNAQI